MKKTDLIKKILEPLPEELEEQEAEHLIDYLNQTMEEAPKCHQCGKYFMPRWECIEIDITWGYESCGKDGDHDQWRLCSSCSKKFKQKFEPICSVCKRSVVEKMGELAAKNPYTVFYGDVDKAVNYFRNETHCGLEYATISGRIVCEVCYEELTDNLEIPIKAGKNSRRKDGSQRKHRIEKRLAYRLSEDASAYYYNAHVKYSLAVMIRTFYKDPEKRIIKARITKRKPEFLARMRARNPDYEASKLTVTTGTNQYINIPLSVLEEEAEKREKKLDISQISIEKSGQELKLGEIVFSVPELINHGSD